jgi:hypothetical protein
MSQQRENNVWKKRAGLNRTCLYFQVELVYGKKLLQEDVHGSGESYIFFPYLHLHTNTIS